jgi:hypothetical protein
LRFEKERAALLILHFDVRCLAFDVGCSKRRCETHLGRPVAGRHSYLGGDALRFEKERAALLILHFDVRCLAFDVGCSKRRC